MKTIIVFCFVLLAVSPGWAKSVPEVLKDTKPAKLSLVDSLVLKPVVVRIGASRMSVLVNRLTDKVEYVWSFAYKRYLRPKFTMINAQILYDQFK